MAAFCSPAHAASDEYVVVLYNKGNPYWAAMMDGIKDAAKEKGVTAPSTRRKIAPPAKTS